MKTFSEIRTIIEQYNTRFDKTAYEVDIEEEFTRINQTGSTYFIYLMWRGKTNSIQMFFPQTSRPSKQEVLDAIQKVYPNATLLSYNPCRMDPTMPILHSGVKNGPK